MFTGTGNLHGCSPPTWDPNQRAVLVILTRGKRIPTRKEKGERGDVWTCLPFSMDHATSQTAMRCQIYLQQNLDINCLKTDEPGKVHRNDGRRNCKPIEIE